jgi:hypothetical protein
MSEPGSSYVRSRVCRAAEQPWLCISDEKVLTQFSRNANKYLSEPRYAREREISLLTGKLTIEQAARYVLRSVFTRDIERASVRYTTAGDLRKAGFAVLHTPGRIFAGCDGDLSHVSVIWPADDPVQRQDIPWEPDVTASFTQCFNGHEDEGR